MNGLIKELARRGFRAGLCVFFSRYNMLGATSAEQDNASSHRNTTTRLHWSREAGSQWRGKSHEGLCASLKCHFCWCRFLDTLLTVVFHLSYW